MANINTALRSLSYRALGPGPDTISYSFNDGGATGAGGQKITAGTISVRINAVPAPPPPAPDTNIVSGGEGPISVGPDVNSETSSDGLQTIVRDGSNNAGRTSGLQTIVRDGNSNSAQNSGLRTIIRSIQNPGNTDTSRDVSSRPIISDTGPSAPGSNQSLPGNRPGAVGDGPSSGIPTPAAPGGPAGNLPVNNTQASPDNANTPVDQAPSPTAQPATKQEANQPSDTNIITTSKGSDGQGFTIAVQTRSSEANNADTTKSLTVFKGIPDVAVSDNSVISFQVPVDAFSSPKVESVVTLTASLPDGGTLPSWLSFDPVTGRFEGEVPQGMETAVEVTVTATDENGNTVTTSFKIGDTEGSVVPDNDEQSSLIKLKKKKTALNFIPMELHGRKGFNSMLAETKASGPTPSNSQIREASKALKLAG